MNEARHSENQVKAFEKVMYGGFDIKFHDSVTLGIPDRVWCWAGRTCWIEYKFDPGSKISEQQKLTLSRLRRTAGYAYLITFTASPQMISVVDPYTDETLLEVKGFKYDKVAQFIRQKLIP